LRALRRLLHVVRRLLGTDAVHDLAGRVQAHDARLAAVERDLARIGPQVAALEARLEGLRQTLPLPRLETGELDTTAALVQEVRREHDRMRARVSAAVRFEERLGQLEEQMAALRRPT
jgi:chromosome segregation ATPase